MILVNKNGEFSLVYKDDVDYTNIVIPEAYNGIRLSDMKSIDEKVKGIVEEITIPNTVYHIGNVFTGMAKIRKITIKKEPFNTIVIKDIKTLEEINIDYETSHFNAQIKNLPKLKRVNFKKQPEFFSRDTFVNCKSLEIQNMLQEGLVDIEYLAFDRVNISNILLPKSLIRFSLSSFIPSNKNNIIINITNSNVTIDTRLMVVKKANKNLIKIIAPVGTYIPSKSVEVEYIDTKDKALVTRALKSQILGSGVVKNSIAVGGKAIKYTIAISDRETFKNSINTLIKSAIYNKIIDSTISNGFNSLSVRLSFDMYGINSAIKGNHIKILELNKSTIVSIKNRVYVICTDKDILSNRIDESDNELYNISKEILLHESEYLEIVNTKEFEDRLIIYSKRSDDIIIRY